MRFCVTPLNREHTNGQVTNASYAKVIETVLKSGVQADDRTGTGTLSTCYVPSYYMLTGGDCAAYFWKGGKS